MRILSINNSSDTSIEIDRRTVSVFWSTSDILLENNIRKASMRKFKGCKVAVLDSTQSGVTVQYYLIKDLRGSIRNVRLCRKKLYSYFWCIPKTIYYA